MSDVTAGELMLLAVFAVGFGLGWYWRARWMIRRLRRYVETHSEEKP